MKRTLRGVLLSASIAMAAFSTASADTTNNPVIAIVKGEKIYLNQALNLKNAVPELQTVSFETVFPTIRDQMVAEILLKHEVKKAKLDDDKEVQERAQKCMEAAKLDIFLKHEVEKRVTDDSLMTLFKTLMKEYKKQKEVKAHHILVESEAEAQKVIKELEKGMSFSDAVKKYTKDKASIEKGGALSDNYFIKDQAKELLGPEFAEAVFILRTGTHTRKPVKTRFGYHIVKVEDSRTTKPPKFEEVAPQLRMLKNQEALMQLIEELKTGAEVAVFDMQGKPATMEKPKMPAPGAAAPEATA